MIAPEYHIRDCVEADMDLIRYLFSVEGFSDLTSPEGIRVAVTPDSRPVRRRNIRSSTVKNSHRLSRSRSSEA